MTAAELVAAQRPFIASDEGAAAYGVVSRVDPVTERPLCWLVVREITSLEPVTPPVDEIEARRILDLLQAAGACVSQPTSPSGPGDAAA